jgi:phosphate transport system substrate-binding protein
MDKALFTTGKTISVVALVFSSFFSSASAQTSGTGSSLVRDLMSGWTAQHGLASGGARYEATGSSAGVAAARDGTADYGISDVPLTAAALQQGNLRQIPLAGAAVAVVLNLPEFGSKPIKLTGDILASIFLGEITQWNHSQIAAANPGQPLPARAIIPVWRSDGSGQSYVFSNYLARGNSKWRRTPGTTNNLSQLSGRGVRGGAAVIETVKATPGAIGYESLGAAQKAGLAVAELRNASDKFVAPSAASINEALSQARWATDSLSADLDGSAGAGSYPMTAVPYALISGNRKGGVSPVPFLKAAVAGGDGQVSQNGFVPLPSVAKNLVTQVR